MHVPATCLVCGADAFRPHLDILLQCQDCGFVTARTDGAMDYRSLYGGAYFKGDEYLDYAADECFFKKNFRRRLADVLRHTPRGRLLEIGAAYGFFLDLARRHFDVIGYEVNHEGAAYAHEHFGIDVRTDDFLQASIGELGGAVDVTVMWDVIEHLEHPQKVIQRIAEFTRPGGMLHITTGDIGSRLACLRGRKWRLIHPPTHLHYFDRRTLPQLLARYGFRTLEIRSVGVARSFRQILYSVLVLRLNRPALYDQIHKWLPPSLGFTLNTFDIMRIAAVRD
jgi:SAM-dependent methyltransferase